MKFQLPGWTHALATSALSVIAALCIGAVLLAVSGYDVGTAYTTLLRGGIGLNTEWAWGEALIQRPVRLGNMLNEASLLIMVALAVAIPLWCGMINLGGEGQILMGGLGAVLAALFLPEMPVALHAPIVFAAGAIAGGAWAGLAGLLKVYRGMNEIITTIMLNFVAFWTITALTQGPLKDRSSVIGHPWTPEIPGYLKLPFIWQEGRLLLILPMAGLSTLAVYALYRYTVIGFQMRASGLEPGTAAFVGFPVQRLQVLTMVFSGAMCGIAGAALLTGLQYRLSDAFSANYGFDALAVVCVGQGHPVGIAAAGILFATLRTGAEAMEVTAGVPKSLGIILQAVALLMLMIFQGRAISAWWRKWRTAQSIH